MPVSVRQRRVGNEGFAAALAERPERKHGSHRTGGAAADHPYTPLRPKGPRPLPTQTLAAALAAVVLLPLLVFVNAPTAEAHERTRYRCAYDPITNVRQCWSETVAHTHRTIPDNPPPDTRPKPKKCPSGTTGTPPDCSPVPSDNTNREPETATTTATAPKSCPPGQHSNGGAGKNCHSHSFTPPCGTGTWSPGHGHTAIQRLPCPEKEKCPSGQTGTPPNCQAEDDKDGTGTKGTRSNRPAQTECPNILGTHPHLDREKHNHKLLSNAMAGCHDASDGHRHSDGTRHSSGTVDLDKDTAPGQECPTDYFHNGSVCELKTGLKIVQRGGELVWEGTGEVVCTLVGGGIASRVVKGILTNVPKAAKWFAERGVEQVIEHPCDEAWEELQELSTSQIFESEIVPPVQYDDPPPVPGDTDGDGSVSDDEVAEATRKFLNGEIDGNELNKIQNRRDCDKGYSWAQNCE